MASHDDPANARRISPHALGRIQLAWLAAAVFVVSAGYGVLMPLMPAWLQPVLEGAGSAAVARHVGLLGGVYAAGVLVGAPLWGLLSDRAGRARVLVAGLIGYTASLLPLLWPQAIGLPGIYVLRGAAGFFVAAIVPVVPALVAEHTPRAQRARRFAWLGAMSLLGFLFSPALNVVAEYVAGTMARLDLAAATPMNLAIVMTAALGALTMAGLAVTLPAAPPPEEATPPVGQDASDRDRAVALCALNGAVMFVLAGFELGIVLQGQQHPDLTPRDISLMFAECSLVMLAVNAALFFTGLLDRAAGKRPLAAGLVLAVIGLALLAQHRGSAWMYTGISLTAAGTGLVLPTVSFLAAGVSRHRLGATMGALAAAASLGQSLGSTAGGWLFGAVAQLGFAWLALPLLGTLAVVLARPAEWLQVGSPKASALRPSRPQEMP